MRGGDLLIALIVPAQAFYMTTSSPVSLRARYAAARPAPPVMSAAVSDGASLLDASLGVGYQGAGEDWSHAKSSERKDRPLTNEQLKVLTAKSNAAGATASVGVPAPALPSPSLAAHS